MDTSLIWISQLYEMDQASLRRFRRALRRPDQRALDELLKATQKPMEEAAIENFPVPLELFLVAILLEEQKEVIRIKAQVEQLEIHLIGDE